MNFSLGGLCNYRLCFKVDCVSIMLATERGRKRDKVEEPGAREAETGWGRERRERERKEEPQSTERPIDSAILSLVLWALEYTGLLESRHVIRWSARRRSF